MWGGVEWDIPCLLQAKKKNLRKIESLNPQIQHHKKHKISIIKSMWLMFQEIITAACENHTKPT